MPAVRVSLMSMKREMIMAVSQWTEEIRKEVEEQVERMCSEEGFKEEVAKTVQEEWRSVLRGEVRDAVQKVLAKHKGLLEEAAMEVLTDLLRTGKVGEVLQE